MLDSVEIQFLLALLAFYDECTTISRCLTYARSFALGDYDDTFVQDFVDQKLNEFRLLSEFGGTRAPFSLDISLLTVPIRSRTLLTFYYS